MTTHFGSGGLVVLGISAMLALAGCSVATSEEPEGAAPVEESTVPSEAAVTGPVTACPEGFVDAYGAEIAGFYDPADFEYREAAVEEFPDEFLRPFLDGGCAVFFTGTDLTVGFVAQNVVGFSPDASIIPDIAAAFEEAGFEPDPSLIGTFSDDVNGALGGYVEVGGPVGTMGEAALAQFYPGGVAFY